MPIHFQRDPGTPPGARVPWSRAQAQPAPPAPPHTRFPLLESHHSRLEPQFGLNVGELTSHSFSGQSCVRKEGCFGT